MSPSTKAPTAERHFRAMGTDCHVLVVGSDDPGDRPATPSIHLMAEGALARIEELEQRWSRFRPDSELSRLNGDRSSQVSHDTFLLIERSVFAWKATNGRFNPTMGAALDKSGYDRPFAELEELNHRSIADQIAVPGQCAEGPLPVGPTCAGIVIDAFTSTVWLPDGVHLDPGGIGKGLAADIVTRELLDVGAVGALVNLGGDLRVRGVAPHGGPWYIDIREPTIDDQTITTLALHDGAVASSTPLRRTWSVDGKQHHHLLDAFSNRSNQSAPHLVTVVSSEAWWAEVTATAAASKTGNPLDPSFGDGFNQTAMLQIASNNSRSRSGGFEQYETTNAATLATSEDHREPIEIGP